MIVRPTRDVTPGDWIAVGAASLYGAIDETSASGTDFIVSPPDPVSESCEVAFGTPSATPNLDSGHTLHYQVVGTGEGTLTVQLVQLATVIATWAQDFASGDYEHTIADSEAAAITDYTDLRLRFTADTGTSGILMESGDDLLVETGDRLLMRR